MDRPCCAACVRWDGVLLCCCAPLPRRLTAHTARAPWRPRTAGKGPRLQYKVKWQGWPEEHNSWVNKGDVSKDLIAEFEERERQRTRTRTAVAPVPTESPSKASHKPAHARPALTGAPATAAPATTAPAASAPAATATLRSTTPTAEVPAYLAAVPAGAAKSNPAEPVPPMDMLPMVTGDGAADVGPGDDATDVDPGGGATDTSPGDDAADEGAGVQVQRYLAFEDAREKASKIIRQAGQRLDSKRMHTPHAGPQQRQMCARNRIARPSRVIERCVLGGRRGALLRVCGRTVI